MKVSEYIELSETYNNSDQFYLKWLIEEELISSDYELSEQELLKIKSICGKAVYRKYLSEQLFDVVLFSRSGKKILCNQEINIDDARLICRSNESKGVNYCAGFCVTGTYSNIEKGEDFIITENNKVINPKI